MEHTTIYMTPIITTRSFGGMDGTTVGHGDLGTHGTDQFGVGITFTIAITGDAVLCGWAIITLHIGSRTEAHSITVLAGATE